MLMRANWRNYEDEQGALSLVSLNPLTLNRYDYVLNNPETMNDPSGHYDAFYNGGGGGGNGGGGNSGPCGSETIDECFDSPVNFKSLDYAET
jgi:hypothetical protein